MGLPPHTDPAILPTAADTGIDNSRRHMLAAIMCVDLFAHAAPAVQQEVAITKLLDQLISNTVAKANASSHLVTSTMDGVAICFMGEPKEALDSARLLRDLLQIKKYNQQVSIRIGLHFGPVRIIPGANKRHKAVGEELNVARRIMNFSRGNQIVASRPYYDIVSRIGERVVSQFVHVGERKDQEMTAHDLYVVVDSNIVHSPIAAATVGIEDQPKLAVGDLIAHDVMLEIEADLARVIGPLAKVLVSKAVQSAKTEEQLREQLGVYIPDATLRDEFIRAASKSRVNSAVGVTGNGLKAPSSDVHKDRRQQTSSQSALSKRAWLTEEQQCLIERALGEYVGPLAKTLVRREVAQHTTFPELLDALAQQIDAPGERDKFLTAAHKIQG